MSASHKTEWSVGAFILMGFACAFVLINALIDLLYPILDPRQRPR